MGSILQMGNTNNCLMAFLINNQQNLLSTPRRICGGRRRQQQRRQTTALADQLQFVATRGTGARLCGQPLSGRVYARGPGHAAGTEGEPSCGKCPAEDGVCGMYIVLYCFCFKYFLHHRGQLELGFTLLMAPK